MSRVVGVQLGWLRLEEGNNGHHNDDNNFFYFFFTLNTIVVRLYAIRTCELSIVILLSKLLGFSFENSTSNCAI